MDKSITMFSEQLDVAIKPETLFPDKKVYTKECVLLKFISGKNRKKNANERPVINNAAQAEPAL